jgi:hypothetical protein
MSRAPRWISRRSSVSDVLDAVRPVRKSRCAAASEQLAKTQAAEKCSTMGASAAFAIATPLRSRLVLHAAMKSVVATLKAEVVAGAFIDEHGD